MCAGALSKRPAAVRPETAPLIEYVATFVVQPTTTAAEVALAVPLAPLLIVQVCPAGCAVIVAV